MKEQILKKLKALRIEKEVKPMVLAEYLGIDESTYLRMEKGTNNTWGEYLYKLLEYYHVSPSKFFSDIDGKNFIHQANNQTAMGVVEKNYSDKSMVKSMFNEKDKRIELLEFKINTLENEMKSKNIESELKDKKIIELQLENAYLKGKRGE